jgi:hypothetical protein
MATPRVTLSKSDANLGRPAGQVEEALGERRLRAHDLMAARWSSP